MNTLSLKEGTPATQCSAIDFTKVCMSDLTRGVLIGYKVLVPPVTEKDRNVLRTIQSVSQDLSKVTSSTNELLPLSEGINIIEYFIAQPEATKYRDFLL